MVTYLNEALLHDLERDKENRDKRRYRFTNDLLLESQPPVQPQSNVNIHSVIRGTMDRSQLPSDIENVRAKNLLLPIQRKLIRSQGNIIPKCEASDMNNCQGRRCTFLNTEESPSACSEFKMAFPLRH